MRFFSRKKPRVYLNTIRVAKVDEDFNFLDKMFSPEYKEIDSKLEGLLREVVTLPKTSERQGVEKTDIGIDIIIPDYESGGFECFNLGEMGIPFLWRPRIKVVSRLFNINPNETIRAFSVTEKMGWRHFFSRLFRLRTLFGFSGFTSKDFEFLLLKASCKLVDKMRKVI